VGGGDVNAIAARLLKSTVLTGISDGLFSSVLVTVFYGSTFALLWQGVASTLFGRGAFDGGTPFVLAGLAMHFCVAFGWSAVFLFIVSRATWVFALLQSRFGVFKVAAMYGPCVWLMMSLVIIPLVTGHGLPTLTYRWWVQFFGHVPFVAIPIVWSVSSRTPQS
jgi:hypothetical protein